MKDQNFIFQNLDIILLVLGIIISLILIVRGIVSLNIISVFIGILLAISSLIWNFIRNNYDNVNLENYFKTVFTYEISLYILFIGLFILSIFILYTRIDNYQRPLSYFLILALMVGLIVLEIVRFKEPNRYIILFQIFVVGINYAWSQVLIYPSLVGWDPWVHQLFTQEIVAKSIIPNGFGYTHFPIFHLLNAIAMIFGNLDYKIATLLSISLMELICNIFFIYLLSYLIFNNNRVSLFSSLLLVLSPGHIYMSYILVPNGFAGIFLIIIFFVIFKIVKNERNYSNYFVMGLLMFLIILTHTITSFCLAILLFISYFAFKFYDKYQGKIDFKFPLLIPIIYTTFLFLWWTYDYYKVNYFINFWVSIFSFQFIKIPSEQYVGIYNLSQIDKFFSDIGNRIYVFLSFSGLCYSISRYKNKLSINLFFLSMTLILIVLIGGNIGVNILLHRWYFITGLFLSIPLAITIVFIYILFHKKNFFPNLNLMIIVALIALLIIINPDANIDNNPLTPNVGNRYVLLESELVSIKTISNYTYEKIKTDKFFAESGYYMGYNSWNFDEEIYSKDYSKLGDSILLISNEIIGKPYLTSSGINKFDYDLNFMLNKNGFSQIYNCGNVKGYVL